MSKKGLFPDDRFVAFDQFLKLFGFSKIEWHTLFKVLNCANCGFLKFYFGDISVEIKVGSGESLGKGENDWLQLIFLRIEDYVEKTTTYTFEISELKNLRRKTTIKGYPFDKL